MGALPGRDKIVRSLSGVDVLEFLRDDIFEVLSHASLPEDELDLGDFRSVT